MHINDKVNAEGRLEIIKRWANGTEEVLFDDHNVICKGLGQSIAEYMSKEQCGEADTFIPSGYCDTYSIPGKSSEGEDSQAFITGGGSSPSHPQRTPGYTDKVCCFKIITIKGSLRIMVKKADGSGNDGVAAFGETPLEIGDEVQWDFNMEACAFKWCSFARCDGRSYDLFGSGESGEFGPMIVNCKILEALLNANSSWNNQTTVGDNGEINLDFTSGKLDGCCDMRNANPTDRTAAGECITHSGGGSQQITAGFLRDVAEWVVSTQPNHNTPDPNDTIDIMQTPDNAVLGGIMNSMRNEFGVNAPKRNQPKMPKKCPHQTHGSGMYGV